jgi:hypothetical protein
MYMLIKIYNFYSVHFQMRVSFKINGFKTALSHSTCISAVVKMPPINV